MWFNLTASYIAYHLVQVQVNYFIMTFISDIVTGAISFTAALSQQATNG